MLIFFIHFTTYFCMKNLFPLLLIFLIGFSACKILPFSPSPQMKAEVNGQSWKDNAPVLSFSPATGRFELKGKGSDGTEIHLFSMQAHTDFTLNENVQHFSLPFCGFIDPLNPTQPPACTWLPGYAIQANQWQFGVISSCEDSIAHYAFQLSTDMGATFTQVAHINALGFFYYRARLHPKSYTRSSGRSLLV